MLDFSYIKFLNYINKNNKISWIDLTFDFKISKNEAREIVKKLYEDGFVSRVGDTGYIPTYKCRHYIKSFISSWLCSNLLAIIAIVISIIALFK